MSELTFSLFCIIIFVATSVFVYDRFVTVKKYTVAITSEPPFKRLAVVSASSDISNEKVIEKIQNLNADAVIIIDNPKFFVSEQIASKLDTHSNVFIISKQTGTFKSASINNEIRVYNKYSVTGSFEPCGFEKFKTLDNYKIAVMPYSRSVSDTEGTDLAVQMVNKALAIYIPFYGDILISKKATCFGCKTRAKTVTVAVRNKPPKTEVTVVNIKNKKILAKS